MASRWRTLTRATRRRRCRYPLNSPNLFFDAANPIGWESLDCTGAAFVRLDSARIQSPTPVATLRAAGGCVSATVPQPEGIALFRFGYPVRLQPATIRSRMTTPTNGMPVCAALPSPLVESQFPLEKVSTADVTVFDGNFTGWSLDP